MNFTSDIQCPEGHCYLLEFKDCNNLPIDIETKVVDITLTLDSKTTIINNLGTLDKIASIILNFLDDNDVILYFYCSHDSIRQRDRLQNLSHQQYRSRLFSAMFKKAARYHAIGTYVNNEVKICDQQNGDHYLHFIAANKYSEKMTDLVKNVESAFDK